MPRHRLPYTIQRHVHVKVDRTGLCGWAEGGLELRFFLKLPSLPNWGKYGVNSQQVFSIISGLNEPVAEAGWAFSLEEQEEAS